MLGGLFFIFIFIFFFKRLPKLRFRHDVEKAPPSKDLLQTAGIFMSVGFEYDF